MWRRCAITRAGVGGPALRAMGFHDRARLLKALAQHLDTCKAPLYRRSPIARARRWPTARSTSMAASARCSSLPPRGGARCPMDRSMSTAPRSSCRAQAASRASISAPRSMASPCISTRSTSPSGACWKSSRPSLLAGVPVIVKPATASCHVTEACVRAMIDSAILPDGALQLITGGTGPLLDLSGLPGCGELHGLRRDRAQAACKSRICWEIPCGSSRNRTV